MIKYLINKSLIYCFSIFCILSLTFFLLCSVPGDPFAREMTLPLETIQSLRAHYGLDRPIFFRYLLYLKNMLIFEFGPSFSFEGRNVLELIVEAFPISFSLGLQSAIFSLLIGFSLGCYLGMHEVKHSSSSLSWISTIGLCIPNFIFASLLQYIFAVKWPLFPVGRWDGFTSSFLPVISLSLVPTFQIAKIVSTSVIDILEQNYIKTARSKGFSDWQIWRLHVMKNASIPLFSYLIPLCTYLFMGSFIIEHTFSLPGLGSLLVTSIETRDYGCVSTLVFLYSVVLFSIQWIVESIQSFIDPRLRS